MTARPSLAVVVAAQNGLAEATERCLDSLARQGLAIGEELEVLVVYPGDPDPDGAAGSWAGVRTLATGEAASLPSLHGRGIAATCAPLVALTEAHVRLAPGWAAAVLAAHAAAPVAAIGGAVEPERALSVLDRAVFFCDYGQFLEPLDRHETVDLPGCNVIFRREFLPSARVLDERGFWKTFHCQELARQGALLRSEPTIVVYYGRRLSLCGMARRRWSHGRCFGAMRARDWPRWRRAALALAAPALPWILTARVVRRVYPKRRRRGALARSLPLCLLAISIWVVGEWVGNLAGGAGACGRI